MLNMLMLSVGTRNKIIQYFKQTIRDDGCVVATDMSELAPAVYEADRHYLVPPWRTEGYLDILLDICRAEKINAVMSLIDPELGFLAEHEEEFRKIGVSVIGSPAELCDLALDKMKMYEWLHTHGYHCARSYSSLEAFFDDYQKGLVSFPVFVKPIKGSASISIRKVPDAETLSLLFRSHNGLMIQEMMTGQEIGVDCYIDMISGEPVSIFAKKKILMRAGETDKAVSFKDDRLFALIERFTLECGWRGQIDIDLFDNNGEYYISEVNPRFGGGYPHAFECGCNHMQLIKNNVEGKINRKNIGAYKEGIYMMKYVEVLVK